MCIFCTDHTKKQRNFSAPLLHMLNLKSNNYEKQVNTHLGLFVSMGGNQPPIPLHIIINSALVCERTSNPHLSLLPIHCVVNAMYGPIA